jgi:hypothetical protein
MRRLFQLGDRVRVSDRHLWKAGRVGTIVKIEDRTGNRFTIQFDYEELGFFSEEIDVLHADNTVTKKRTPCHFLRLGDIDLEYIGSETEG